MSGSTAALDTPEGIATALKDARIRNDPRVKRAVAEYRAWAASTEAREQIVRAHARAEQDARAASEHEIAGIMNDAQQRADALKTALEARLGELREARRAKLHELELTTKEKE